MSVLDRLIRVRQIRARLALADLARAQGQAAADAALLERVRALVGGQGEGVTSAAVRSARARIDAQVHDIAAEVSRRRDRSVELRDDAGQRLAAARAAVDAALARRAEQEDPC